ncbi:MAG: hybrid sensor histidine kinase/response regulator [Gammaproteobacteria bacterium]|nr:hybrid sensor histidine kinase/response regulator [Gammaproteobacteria bacterium]
MELFLTEAETHVAVLNEGLLALEETPGDPERLEGLMRAAHSIKGGARVVGLDAAVRIAHAMEDCFSAAQKGELSLEAEQIDLLLRGADMLAHLSKTDGSPSSLHEIQEEISYLHTAISALRHAETVLPAPPPSRPSVPLPMPAENVAEASGQTNSAIKPASVKSEDNDRMVRVTASKIERLLGRAGEVVVNARWLPSFTDSLLELKRNRMELAAFLDELQDALLQNGRDPRALRLLTQAREKNKESGLCLADRLAQLEQFSSMSATHADRLYHEMVGVRMRPFADGARGFPRMVRDLARELGKKVRFEIIGKAVEVDQDIQEKLDAPLNHLLRNALDHGIELPEERLTAGKPDTASLRLEAGHRSGMLMISVIDDGRGIEPELLKHKILHKGLATADMAERLSETELMDFLFLPGFSTTNKITDISGRGVGLDVVHSMVHEVGGVVRATSKPGKGMTFHLELPLTLSVIRTFLVEIAGEPYAFPLARIEHCLELSQADIALVEDRQYFRFADDNIALVDIHEVLDIAAPARQPDEFEIVVVSDRLNAYGLVVDKFLGECELVVRPLDPRLGKVPDISATAVMQDGCPVLIFDVDDLVRSIDNLLSGKRLHKLNDLSEEAGEAAPKRVLVVDDSITVREMERKLLESHGYQVEVAVDGKEGWNAIRTSDFELLVSDVDMPRMNGIELISHVKQHEELKSIPVIIISYKDREEDRLRGLEAGANYYLTKSSFEDDSFINAVTDLIGEA